MIINTLSGGRIVQMDIPLPPVTAPARVVTSSEFLALWTKSEYSTAMKDDDLAYAQAQAMAQGTVNLDSPLLPPLLQRAVTIQAITQQRAMQIAAGTPPA